MDPPYGANVMYGELSDFFYVWLKRTAGLVAPELFTRRLTDKQSEAVANKAHFKGQKSADALANRDYQEKMAAIFAECRRVLKPNGSMNPHDCRCSRRRVLDAFARHRMAPQIYAGRRGSRPAVLCACPALGRPL